MFSMDKMVQNPQSISLAVKYLGLLNMAFRKYCRKCFHVYLGTKSLTLSQTANFRLFQTERVCRQQF